MCYSYTNYARFKPYWPPSRPSPEKGKNPVSPAQGWVDPSTTVGTFQGILVQDGKAGMSFWVPNKEGAAEHMELSDQQREAFAASLRNLPVKQSKTESCLSWKLNDKKNIRMVLQWNIGKESIRFEW